MATPQENLARFQEIANRGLQDRLDPDKRARFDEAARRGLLTLPQEERSAGEFAKGVIDQVGQGLTFNLSDELGAGIAAAVAAAQDERPFMEAIGPIFTDIVGSVREEQSQFARENPGTALAANIVGGLATGGVGAGRVAARNAAREALEGTARTSARREIGQQAGLGAAEGLVAGAAGEENIEDAVTSGLVGAAVGGGLGGGIGAGVRGLRNRAANRAAIREGLESGSTSGELVGKRLDDSGRIRNVPEEKEAVNQGVDPGMVRLIATATPATRKAMREMTRVSQTAQTDRLARAMNRPSDVIGDSITNRLRVVESARRRAGRDLEDAVSNLQGRPGVLRVEGESGSPLFQGAIQRFEDELEKLGATINREGRYSVDLKGSRIDDIGPAERIINRIVRNLSSGGNDALAAHNAKQYIDELVDFAKQGEGLAGNTERIVKQLRRDLNEVLIENFPAYADANQRYYQARGAINQIRDAAGSRIDISGDNSSMALGTLTRDFTNNNRGRQRTINALSSLDEAARRYREFDDDILSLAEFAIELDDLFGRQDRTSFGGEIVRSAGKAIRGNMSDVAAEAGEAALRAIRGQNQENAYRALFQLLRDQQKEAGTGLAVRAASELTEARR